MKKMVILMAVLLLALPMAASAAVSGACVNCHTMHGSEQGSPVDDQLNENLLRFDCMGCHAVSTTGSRDNTDLVSGNKIPQVVHGDTDTKAGGKFNQDSQRKVHSVSDVVGIGALVAVPLAETLNDEPPGIPHSASRAVFTSEGATSAFDMFTCAGARGCHGTRAQALVAETVDNGTANVWEIKNFRTGMAALTGAHHSNATGARESKGYNGAALAHNGSYVGAGYRFIPGLFGYENDDREFMSDTDHNEYYGADDGFGTGCYACHALDLGSGANQHNGLNSGIKVPNNSMSGFCSTCHGNFHSNGNGNLANDDKKNDYRFNGVSGAFLRHPSDYIIPNAGEYAAIGTYNSTAPVARPSVVTSASASVTAGTDMVMCLSCHVAHGSANDYLLRFDYNATTTAILAGSGTVGDGGCLYCHTTK